MMHQARHNLLSISPRLFSTLSATFRAQTSKQINTDPQNGDNTEWKTSLDWESELRRRQKIAKERGRRGTKFVDKLRIQIKAGDGGDGGVSFHREKFVSKGGPSGGNGGKGGSVYFRPSEEIQSLNRIPRKLKAPVGGNGGGQWMHGKAGEDLVVDVPVGTIVKELRSNERTPVDTILGLGPRPPKAEDLLGEDLSVAQARRAKLFVHYPDSEKTNQTNEVLKQIEINLIQEYWEVERLRRQSDPLEVDCAQFFDQYRRNMSDSADLYPSSQVSKSRHDSFLVAKGGDGGIGNSNFSGNQTTLPRFATRGKKGELIELELELKTLADVGLVGFPNSGKSTLIHTLTNSQAEIAPYAFTTVNPQIGTLIIFDDGTWDMDNQSSSINHSPAHKEYYDATSASGLIRDRSVRRQPKGRPSKVESVRLTIADCPGLLPKASENIGLGHAFLRHIERSKMLIVVVDLLAGVPGLNTQLHPPKTVCMDPDRACRDVEMLFKELEAYQTGLSARVGIVVANKADLSTASPELEELAKIRLRTLEDYLKLVQEHQLESRLGKKREVNLELVPVSAKYRHNIRRLVKVLKDSVEARPPGKETESDV